MARLAEQFVCVRIQAMNGVNLGLFQFDGDLTWMAFFMDTHDRFYARYGGREDDDAESHLTKASLLRVMNQVLALHKTGAVQRSGYEPTGTPVALPEDISPMKGMLERRKPDQRCIHCHDVKNMQLRHLRQQGKLSKDLIFTYPPPVVVGIELDPDDQTRIRAVKTGSPAAHAGVAPGDVLAAVNGHRILTAADFSRVLELTPKEARLTLDFYRAGRLLRTTVRLSGDWRKREDPSWRASVNVVGPGAGFWAVALNESEKRAAGVPPDGLALRVTTLFPKPPLAREAGLRNGDVVVEVDGKRSAVTIRQLQAHMHLNHNYGDKVPIVIRRGGQEMKLALPLADKPWWDE